MDLTARHGRRLFTALLAVGFGVLISWVMLAADQQETDVQGEMARLQQELARLRLQYTDAHPSVINAKRRLEELRRIPGSKQSAPDQNSAELVALREQLKVLLTRYTDAHPKVKALRERIRELEHGAPPPPPRADVVEQLSRRALPSPAPSPLRPQHPQQTWPDVTASFNQPLAEVAEPFYANGRLRLPITVKEVAGVGSTHQPITAVIPVPYGRYQTSRTFV